MRTDVVDGLPLRSRLSALQPGVSRGARVLDHESLDLRPFIAGARIVVGRDGHRRVERVADPRREPSWAISSLMAHIGSPLSTARFGAYVVSRAIRSAESLRRDPDVTTEQALRRAGADHTLIERVLRPFLSGVFLESELSHVASLPRPGSEIFLSEGTPGSWPRHATHTRTTRHRARRTTRAPGASASARAVDVFGGDVHRADAVIVATDPVTAARSHHGCPRTRGAFGHNLVLPAHLRARDLADGQAVLVLDGARRGPLVNTVVLTHAAPDYAPAGSALVSASALGVGKAPRRRMPSASTLRGCTACRRTSGNSSRVTRFPRTAGHARALAVQEARAHGQWPLRRG